MLYKATPPPDIPLFDRFEKLGVAGDALGKTWLVDRRRHLLGDAEASLHDGAMRNRQLSFNALLSELHRALEGPNGDALASRLRGRFPTVLIDEFQDTDRLQARIFERIAPDGLVVVGDPKQSIYRFRGADVFAYVDARRRLERHNKLSLTRNFRSNAALVHAVNAIFSRRQAFIVKEVEFEAVVPNAAPDGDTDASPFQIHLFPAMDDDRVWTKRRLEEAAAEHAANRVVALLQERSSDGAAPLRRSGDICVLVRTGSQGRAMIRALNHRNLRTVELGTDSVFEAKEADSLHRLLHALAADATDYDAPARLRGALADDLFGLDTAGLEKLRDDDQASAKALQDADDWRELWARAGIAVLMRKILFADDPGCARHLLAYPDGPRRLTNFLHLTDLLHEAETRDRLSRRGLLDWFARFKAEVKAREASSETSQLRLESDEELVKIVTVHRAKGLEYPVVLCPFAWWGREPDASQTARYYDVEQQRPVLDLAPSEDVARREQVEAFADELRLLYVALTRAKTRCEVTWAQVKDYEYAPLAWLLHAADYRDPLEAAKRVGDLDAGTFTAEVQAFADTTPTISVVDVDPAEPDLAMPDSTPTNEQFTAPVLDRALRRLRQSTSYSTLAKGAVVAAPSGAHAPEDDQDHDADDSANAEQAERPSTPSKDAFGFPRGSRPGNCLHDIMEHYANGGDLESGCRETLTRFGFDVGTWLPVAQSMAENTWHTRLGASAPDFCLADVDRPIPEMEFHLPVSRFNRHALADILERHGYDRWVPEPQAAIDGYLHGYIDVVVRHQDRWYVLDYKSNWLGGDLAAYTPEAVAASMREHNYHLQYLLYLTALHRFLGVRLPDYDYDRHVGGACYLFMRGMVPDEPGSGVYFDRPGRACIEAIDRCLAGGADGDR